MPYVPTHRRVVLDGTTEGPQTAGELNYLITSQALSALCTDEMFRNFVIREIKRFWDALRSYQSANDVVGALACSVMELQRREVSEKVSSRIEILLRLQREFYFSVVGPYEDKAIARNGDLEFFLNQKEV